MRVLITGGFGYIGANLGEYLLQNGHQVILGSRRDRSSPRWLPQAEVVKIYWEDETALATLCQGVDAIVHAAGMNAQDCLDDPVSAMKFNGVATTRMIQAAIRAGTKRFVYLSTAHVYKSPLEGTIDENTPPQNTHPYASSHLAAEYALSHEVLRQRIEGVSLRLSNGFGIPKNVKSNCWDLLVNDLCRQAVILGKIQLRSSGEQQRDFIPLSTISERTLKILLLPKEALPTTINIGCGQSMNVIDIARLVQHRFEKIFNFKIKIELGKKKEKENKLIFKSLFNEKFGFNQFKIEKSIDEILNYCKLNFQK